MRDALESLIRTRIERPEAIAAAAAARRRPDGPVGPDGRVLVVAADHPARGALGVGGDALAMADRADLLERLVTALARPQVTGVLATPEVIDDLLLLGALENKAVFASMNRGGLAGATWELDDRFTAYDAATIAAMGFQGGKMLTRIDLGDPATAATLEDSGRAVTELAQRRLVAMVEPFLTVREDGRLRVQLTTEAAITASAVAAGLGASSAYTWLKVPVVEDMAAVAGATTLPTVLLGGDVRHDDDAPDRWRAALALPNVIGMVLGRTLLYPPDGSVEDAVDAAADLFNAGVAS